MKHIIGIATLMVLTMGAFAQDPVRPMRGAGMKQGSGKFEGRSHQPFRDLNLTEAQQSQMKELNKAFSEKMKALRENEALTVKEQRDGIFNLTREHRQSVQKVLTPEQRQQMKAKMEAERAKMQQMQNNRFEKMASDLKLTEDQKARLITSREKNRKAMMSLRDQKNMDRTTLEKQRRSIMEQHRAELEQILSKDQLEQWKQANRDGFQRRHPARARGMQKQRIV